MKTALKFLILILITSCEQIKNPDGSKYNFEKIDSSISKSDIHIENEENSSDTIWNQYLNTGFFEQSNPDSLLLICVTPNSAIFIHSLIDYAKNDIDTERIIDYIVAYNINRFEKNAGKWVKLPSEHISIDPVFVGNTFADKWQFTDINGDGKNDILLKASEDGRGNCHYFCYLQKKIHGNFIKFDYFESLENPKFNKISKTISTHSSFHHGESGETFRWLKDSLIFVKGYTQYYPQNRYTKYTDKRRY